MKAATLRPALHPGQAQLNPFVHGARGCFAFAVFVFHVVNSGLATAPVLTAVPAQFALRLGEYGVELFFAVSGFVIAGSLRRAHGPGAFLLDRAIRIYPVLGATVLAIVALGLVTGLRPQAANGWSLFWAVPLNMLAVPGVVPLDTLHPAAWSLSYEVTFYLFCAGAWFLRSRIGWIMPVLVLAAAALVACYPRALLFLVGVLAARAVREGTPPSWLARRPLLALVGFLCCWQGVQVLSQPTHIIDTTMLDWAHDARLPLAAAAIALAIPGFRGLVDGWGPLGRVLAHPVFQYLGSISYSFYLWHPIVMAGVKAALLRTGLAEAAGPWAQALFFALALPPSLAVSDLSQRVLERGAAVWLRRLLHHRPPVQPASLDPTPGMTERA